MRSKQGSTTSNLALYGLIIVLCVAVYLGFLLTRSQAAFASAYATGYRAARTRLATDCPFVSLPMRTLTGTVVSISNDGLVVEQNNLDTDPQVDGVSDQRMVMVSAATALNRLSTNTSAATASARTGLPSLPSLPPAPYAVGPLQLSDIKPGDKVQVTSNDDVRLEATIQATAVQDMSS